MGLLDGKAAFITGGASGIGKGTAVRFAQEGAIVSLADLQPEQGEKARAERFGRPDFVFANAGINGVGAPTAELLPNENLTSTYLTVHYALPHLRRAGGGDNGISVFAALERDRNTPFTQIGRTHLHVRAGTVLMWKTKARTTRTVDK